MNFLCAYKLDLSKAYDRVDWSFLKQVMQKLGCSHRRRLNNDVCYVG
jgi:hypothetical protein